MTADGIGDAAVPAAVTSEMPELDWLRLERSGPTPRVLAEIHATVDLDRALGDARRLVRGSIVRDPPRIDAVLGARVGIVRRPAAGPRANRTDVAPAEALVAVVEPTREGRLAAWLARHGEGLAGWYLAVDLAPNVVAERGVLAGLDVGRAGATAFGPGILVTSARRRRAEPDRLVILVHSASVPSRP
jgi:hypothetical protein